MVNSATTSRSTDAFCTSLQSQAEHYISGLHNKRGSNAEQGLLQWMDESLQYLKSSKSERFSEEQWKGTEVKKYFNQNYKSFPLVRIINREETTPYLTSKYSVVFVNGQYCQFLSSLPNYVSIEVLDPLNNSALQQNHLKDFFSHPFSFRPKDFLAHTNLCLHNGILITINAIENNEDKQDEIINVLHLITDDADQFALNPRLLIKSQGACRATIFENIVHLTDEQDQNIDSTPNVFYNHVTQILVGAYSKISHIKFFNDSGRTNHHSLRQVQVQGHGQFQSMDIIAGPNMVRSHFEIELLQEEAECRADGLYLLNGQKHADIFGQIYHRQSNTRSQQLFKGILKDSSSAVFNGLIKVDKNAQKIESEQLNKNMLLSEKCRVLSRPQLAVAADDVKCGHGAAVGQLSPEEIFYLQTRGIPFEKAQCLLSMAFIDEVINLIAQQELKNYIKAKIKI